MAPVNIPEGYVFVPRRSGVNVAMQLLDAAKEVGADRITSVRTTVNGYHVLEEVADQYQANLLKDEEEADVIETTPGTEGEPPTNIEGQAIEPGQTGEPASVDLIDADGNSVPVEVGPDGAPILPATVEVEPLPVTVDSTHAEIDEYAGSLDPKVEFAANTNKADKIAQLEAARTTQTPAAE